MKKDRRTSRGASETAALGLLAVLLGVLLWQVPVLLTAVNEVLEVLQPGRMTMRLGEKGVGQETTIPSQPMVSPHVSGPSLPSTPVARISLAPDLPPLIGQVAQTWAGECGAEIVDREAADVRLDLVSSPQGRLVSERIYVPVQGFPSLREETALRELRETWSGKDGSLRLLLTAETAADVTRLWGAAQGKVEVMESTELTEALWQDREAVGIVSFERLEPRLKALRLEGLSVVDNRLEQRSWPLALRVWLHGSGVVADSLLARLGENVEKTNRDPEKLTVLVMTGVTAMSRMTAWRMEHYGDYGYPARVIGSELAAADITHISNEVPFVPGCVADPTLNNIVLCSKPEYLAALEGVGADIVGLTGNHQNDFGHEAMLKSLELYAEQGLKVYGGGANDEEARKPLIIMHNGNRLAFLGANQFGPVGAWATAEDPGSARFDLDTMRADIAAVRPLVDLVLVELQYTEVNEFGEYQVEPLPQQKVDFAALSAAGADIVTGVQAHRPQAVDFTSHGLILFGLGNLFFDQMNWWETRQGLIARHTIYDGRHISTELLVTILEDWAQPRSATPEERGEILTTIFAASGW